MTTICCFKLFPHPDEAAYLWKSTVGINTGSIRAIAYDRTYTGGRDGC